MLHCAPETNSPAPTKRLAIALSSDVTVSVRVPAGAGMPARCRQSRLSVHRRHDRLRPLAVRRDHEADGLGRVVADVRFPRADALLRQAVGKVSAHAARDRGADVCAAGEAAARSSRQAASALRPMVARPYPARSAFALWEAGGRLRADAAQGAADRGPAQGWCPARRFAVRSTSRAAVRRPPKVQALGFCHGRDYRGHHGCPRCDFRSARRGSVPRCPNFQDARGLPGRVCAWRPRQFLPQSAPPRPKRLSHRRSSRSRPAP